MNRTLCNTYHQTEEKCNEVAYDEDHDPMLVGETLLGEGEVRECTITMYMFQPCVIIGRGGWGGGGGGGGGGGKGGSP